MLKSQREQEWIITLALVLSKEDFWSHQIIANSVCCVDPDYRAPPLKLKQMTSGNYFCWPDHIENKRMRL
jgi:hypothetical protein